jgi:hypothetical protein
VLKNEAAIDNQRHFDDGGNDSSNVSVKNSDKAMTQLLRIILIYKAPPYWTNPHHRFRFSLLPEMEED